MHLLRSSADTLYFGGGTPSLLSPERLAQVVEVARDRFGLPLTAEVTVEANPRDLDGTGYRALLALAPDHVSLYVLEVEGRTAFSHRQRQGRLALPDDDLVADLYEETRERFAARGLERYEISNFARPGFESRHNGKYWDDAPFLGFGMSAYSYRDGRRWWNHDRFATYCRAVEDGGGAAAVAGERRLAARERAAEALFTGLRRRDGVDLAAFGERYGLDPLAEWADGIAAPSAAGLVEVADGHRRLTDRGVLLSNEVFRAFV